MRFEIEVIFQIVYFLVENILNLLIKKMIYFFQLTILKNNSIFI